MLYKMEYGIRVIGRMTLGRLFRKKQGRLPIASALMNEGIAAPVRPYLRKANHR